MKPNAIPISGSQKPIEPPRPAWPNAVTRGPCGHPSVPPVMYPSAQPTATMITLSGRHVCCFDIVRTRCFAHQPHAVELAVVREARVHAGEGARGHDAVRGGHLRAMCLRACRRRRLVCAAPLSIEPGRMPIARIDERRIDERVADRGDLRAELLHHLGRHRHADLSFAMRGSALSGAPMYISSAMPSGASLRRAGTCRGSCR